MGGVLSDVGRFLKVNFYEGEHPVEPDLRRGLYPFVTVSREYGAGGRTFAETLLELMGQERDPVFHNWRIFDRELCEELAGQEASHSALRALVTEAYQSEIERLILTLLGQSSGQSLAVKKLFENIRMLATFGKVIIIGRAGVCVTQSLPLGVHLRLAAPEWLRIHRLRLGSMNPAQARKILNRTDRGRALLVRNYFQREISDPTLYDAVWNTGRVPFPTIARQTIQLIRERLNAVRASRPHSSSGLEFAVQEV
jgi:hypothetical protein